MVEDEAALGWLAWRQSCGRPVSHAPTDLGGGSAALTWVVMMERLGWSEGMAGELSGSEGAMGKAGGFWLYEKKKKKKERNARARKVTVTRATVLKMGQGFGGDGTRL